MTRFNFRSMKADGSQFGAARGPLLAAGVPSRIAWILWGVLFFAAWTVIAVSPDRHPVNESYADGARAWAKRHPLYVGGGTLFIYAPQSAILHRPFLFLPKLAYEFAWRFTTIGLLAAGVYRLARCCAPGDLHTEDAEVESNDARPPIPGPSPARGEGRTNVSLVGALFLIATILILPKTWTVAINGQATPAMAGLSLLALADFAEHRWWRAAAALMLALAFKPLAIVLILLLGALSWRLGWRLLVVGALFAGFPYIIAEASYVTGQYEAFLGNLNAAAALGQNQEWPQLFSLLHVVGLDLGEAGQTMLQVAGAAATLVAGWQVLRSFPTAEGVVLLYSLASCYLLLLNPRTENNSYTLLMPAVAVLLARAWLIERNHHARRPHLMDASGATASDQRESAVRASRSIARQATHIDGRQVEPHSKPRLAPHTADSLRSLAVAPREFAPSVTVGRIVFLGVIAALLTLGFELTHVVTPSARFVWPCPLGCLLFLGFIAVEIAGSRAANRLTLTKTGSQVIQPTEFRCSA